MVIKFLKDLFYGHNNEAADLGRILGFFGVLGVLASVGWNMSLGLPLDIDKIGIALAAVLTAAAALVYAKDRARTEAAVAGVLEEGKK